MPNNYSYKFIQIIDQRKAFFKQRIPRTKREKKETDKGMLITYRNIDRKNITCQNNNWSFHLNKEMKLFQTVQIKIYLKKDYSDLILTMG